MYAMYENTLALDTRTNIAKIIAVAQFDKVT